MTSPAPLLSVRDLRVVFDTSEGPLTAVDGASFDVPAKTSVALVGESGCGKSVTALAIMRLLASPPARVAAGCVELDGDDLLSFSERRMRKVRGNDISIVFQDPMSSLNPVYSVGSQIVEAIRLHRRVSRRQARREALELLECVGFPSPAQRFDDYPHELSGGMRQRVMIAIALACDPKLIIADEPTTALDMLAAAQVASLLADLQREREMSMLLISHNLGLVAECTQQMIVLYAGAVMECGATAELLAAPAHPYTRALLQSVPPLRRERRRRRATPTRLPTIDGSVPDPRNLPAGCRFSNRCPDAVEDCKVAEPELKIRNGRMVRCILAGEAGAPGEAPH